MSALLVLLASVVSAASGVPPLLARAGGASRAAERMDRTAAALSVLASLVGLAGVVLAVGGWGGPVLRLGWSLPGASLVVAVDGLSALFLIPLFVVSGAGAVYATSYRPVSRHPDTAPLLRLFYGLTVAAIVLIFVAKNSVLFLFGWEVMTLGAFLMVTIDQRQSESRAAGWVYLVAAHSAILALFALFLLVARMSGGSFDLVSLDPGLARTPQGSAVFWLALAAFGIKAGLVPLHVWLPGAHAAAPSHVSALMSGILIKTGIYGLVRVLSLFPDPPVLWGGVLVGLGAVSAVLGVAWALGQHDLKRLLAYHSIENVGIITMGLGLGFAGRAAGQPAWALLGFAGGLLHVVNHALFKALLFLGAGSVIHATGTRQMDRMGGLLRVLPKTAATFLVGAVAICGLPPLNGLVSEWLLYLGLLRTAVSEGPFPAAAAGAVAALALTGGLALACFVKAFGAVFLGSPRTSLPPHGGEPPSMAGPMLLLAALCTVIGLAPVLLGRLLEGAARAAGAAIPRGGLASIAPLGTLGTANVVVLAGVLLASAFLARKIDGGRARQGTRPAQDAPLPTWDCGYAAPSARMQYTSSSFASWCVGYFRWALRPETHLVPPVGPFPAGAGFREHVPEVVLERVLTPAIRGAAWLLAQARVLQRGHLQLYLVYVVATLLFLLLLARA